MAPSEPENYFVPRALIPLPLVPCNPEMGTQCDLIHNAPRVTGGFALFLVGREHPSELSVRKSPTRLGCDSPGLTQ